MRDEAKLANVIIQRYAVRRRLFSDPKMHDLDDPEWLFRVKFCIRALLSVFRRATFENNCVKSNTDRHTLSALQIFGRYCSFWHYKVVRIFARVL